MEVRDRCDEADSRLSRRDTWAMVHALTQGYVNRINDDVGLIGGSPSDGVSGLPPRKELIRMRSISSGIQYIYLGTRGCSHVHMWTARPNSKFEEATQPAVE